MFYQTVLDEFGVADRTGRKLVLLTPAGSMVPPHELKDIVQQFKGCGCWTLKIMFTDSIEQSSALGLVCNFVSILQLRIMFMFNDL